VTSPTHESNAIRSGGVPIAQATPPRRRRSCKLSALECATGQTSKPISATRPPTRSVVAIRVMEKEKTNEISDYSVFFAWACRLLLDWSLHWSRSGFERLRRFGGHPGRPGVPSPYPNSTKIVRVIYSNPRCAPAAQPSS